MDVRPPGNMIRIGVDQAVTQEANLADHTLIVGERYQKEDLKCTTSSYLGRFSSGVMRKMIETIKQHITCLDKLLQF